MNATVQTLVSSFTSQLVTVVQEEVRGQITRALSTAGLAPKRGPGRPKKLGLPVGWTRMPGGPGRTMDRALFSPALRAKQLCPVPGCKLPAAPVYGMVCRDHKKVSKSLIKSYRAARREKKAAVKKAKPVKNGVRGARKATAKAKKK